MRYLRYSDLVERGIVNNRATLYRWIRRYGFPAGVLLGPNSRAWSEDAVVRWLESRSTEDDRVRVLGQGQARDSATSELQK